MLQIGRDDWSASVRLPADVEWVFADASDETAFDPALIGAIDVTIVDAPCPLRHLSAVDSAISPYTLLLDVRAAAWFGEEYDRFFTRKAVTRENLQDRQATVDALPQKYFSRPFGQKLDVRGIQVSPLHAGPVRYEGSSALVVDVDIAADSDFRQLLTWKENIAYDNQRTIELWPEYTKDPGCELELVVQLIQSGTGDVIAEHRSYSEAELAHPVLFAHPTSGYLSCSIFVRGHGRLKVGPLHYRHARRGAGHFLPGGRRIVDARREELFTYFHPGDLTPPLNIYFSGYRPAEGFEGYYMMAGLGHPFLLVTDPRLEGGRFYLGSDELESKLIEVIREHTDELGFTERDLIFSGLSMGSFGALYYGSQFEAHAIVAGKPIVDLGRVAERGRLVRPKEFLTIFDIVTFWNRGDGGGEDVAEFTRRLLERWNGDPGFGDTKLLMSFMQHDDYDDAAYYTLLNTQTGKPTTVIARGYPGRHNDDSASIVRWFVSQYTRVIEEYAESRHGG